MSGQTKAEQGFKKWMDRHYGSWTTTNRNGLYSAKSMREAYAAGQVESEASRPAIPSFAQGWAEGFEDGKRSCPAAPTLLDIAKRLRDEFPGEGVSFSIDVSVPPSGSLQFEVKIWTRETGFIGSCTSLDDAIARMRQARDDDGDANPADLPGADMEIDLETEAV